jgi:hypothetical protein
VSSISPASRAYRLRAHSRNNGRGQRRVRVYSLVPSRGQRTSWTNQSSPRLLLVRIDVRRVICNERDGFPSSDNGSRLELQRPSESGCGQRTRHCHRGFLLVPSETPSAPRSLDRAPAALRIKRGMMPVIGAATSNSTSLPRESGTHSNPPYLAEQPAVPIGSDHNHDPGAVRPPRRSAPDRSRECSGITTEAQIKAMPDGGLACERRAIGGRCTPLNRRAAIPRNARLR